MKTMGIEYRNYQSGDEDGLAEVFNYAFQTLGGNFLKTPAHIVWRYVKPPHAKPEEIQIAYDTDTQQIAEFSL